MNLLTLLSVGYVAYRVLKKIGPKLPLVIGTFISVIAVIRKRSRIKTEILKLVDSHE